MRRGLTLLEVLVAGVILSIGILGTLELIGSCAASSGRAQDRTRALMFARSKMDEVLKEPVLQTGTDQGQGVDMTTDYDWVVDISPSANPALDMIIVTATNRTTKVFSTISTLRRPSLDPDSESTSTSTGTTSATPSAGGAGATR